MESIDNINLLTFPQQETAETPSNMREVLNDIYTATVNWRLWSYMAIAETRRRYRRTVIGPFWTTLNLAIFISCMGMLLSSLWKQDMKEFLPYFCSGFVCWSLIAAIINEGCMTFISYDGLLKQLPLPYTTFAYFMVSKNVVVFFHHLIILAIVVLYYHVPINLNQLLIIPGLIIVFFTGIWIATLLGLICAKFRDIQQIINSALQLSMFVTPIFWKPGQMGRKGMMLAELNPLYHLVTIIRNPLIGEPTSLSSYVIVISISIVGWLVTIKFFSKNYKKVIFWL